MSGKVNNWITIYWLKRKAHKYEELYANTSMCNLYIKKKLNNNIKSKNLKLNQQKQQKTHKTGVYVAKIEGRIRSANVYQP